MIHVDPALVAPSPVPAAPPPTAPARALIEGQMAMLTRLAQVGMEIAEDCGRQVREARAGADDAAAAAPAAPAPPRDAALAFARVARAVRMTIALQSRLAKDLAALDRADGHAARDREITRRRRLSRLVDQAAQAAVLARRDAGARVWADEEAMEDEIEQLSAEAYERLTDAEDGELWDLPFDEAVAGVCRDLGLSPDWAARVTAAVVAPPPGLDPADPHPPPPRAARDRPVLDRLPDLDALRAEALGVLQAAGQNRDGRRFGHASHHPPDPCPSDPSGATSPLRREEKGAGPFGPPGLAPRAAPWLASPPAIGGGDA